MNYTSQKSTFQTYSNGTSPHIGEAANKEEPGYWYIGTENTGIKAQGADALTMLLSNDSDIIVRNNLGVIVGDLPTTQVFALQGANQIENATFTETAPPNFEKGSDKHYTFENGLLTIKKIPDDFEGGTFTFTYSGISKSFSLKVVSSEVDYNLIIGQTLINTTNVDGTKTVNITAKKISSEGTEIINKNISGKVKLQIGNKEAQDNETWSVSYEQGDTAPISIILKINTDGGWIEWDKETIEFVANGAKGDSAPTLETRYKNSATIITSAPTDNDPSGWDKEITTPGNNERTYMIQKFSNEDTWSIPIPISGLDGDPGADGSDIKYVYYRCKGTTESPAPGTNALDGYTGSSSSLPYGWKESPQGVTEEWLYEYVSVSTKPGGNNQSWSPFSSPVIWSKWGEKGQDGDGVTYYYCQMTTEEKPVYPAPTDKKYQWTNDPWGVDEEHPFEYVATKATSAIEIYAKKANVGPRTYARTAWEDYGAIGKRNSWTIQATGVNNSHISIGDYAYIESITNDDERTLVRLYGEVVALNNPNEYQGSIDLISKRLVFGEGTYKVALWAKWSKDGIDGTSPYTISLDEDFCSIPATYDGTIASGWSISITPTVYYGDDEFEDWSNGSSSGKMFLSVESSNLDVTWKDAEKAYAIAWSGEENEDRGTVTFILKDSDGKEKARTTFEAIKQKAGNKGDSPVYIYAKAEPNVLHKDKLQDVEITLYQKEGSSLPQVLKNSSIYAKYLLGGSWVPSGTREDPALSFANGAVVIKADKIAEVQGPLQIKVYKNEDNTWECILDKITIEVLEDGAPAVAYWLQCSTPIIAKSANGDYQTSSVTFTPMIQVGNGTPDICGSDVTLKIWKDSETDANLISTSNNGAKTINLGTGSGEYNVASALICKMYLNGIKVDEQTAEVLADGVTISNIHYAVTSTVSKPEDNSNKWGTDYPTDSLNPPCFLHTRTTYSNGQKAYQTTHLAKDGDSIKGDNGDSSETIFIYYRTKSTTVPTPTIASDLSSNKDNNIWTSAQIIPIKDYPYVFKSTGIKKTAGDTSEVTYSSWTVPELYSAHYGDGDTSPVDGQTAATFFKLFGLGKENDGMKYDEKGNLYINAEMINTGTLTVKKGGDGEDSNETIFSAGWNDEGEGSVYLAGWIVTNNQLSYRDDEEKNLGQKGTFGIYPRGLSSGLHTDFTGTLDGEDAWVMTAGNNFGVTKNGMLFANSGYIGSMAIEEIESLGNITVGAENLISDGYSQTIEMGPDGWIEYRLSEDLVVGEVYTISFEFVGNYGTAAIVETRSGVLVEIPIDATKAKQEATFTAREATDRIDFWVLAADGYDGDLCSILKLQLEKGNISTDWHENRADLNGKISTRLNANENNKFSWKFSPTEGMFMWNGPQTNEPIFKVWNNPTSGAHELFLRGHVEAESGNIGLLSIRPETRELLWCKEQPYTLNISRTIKTFKASHTSSYYLYGIENASARPERISVAVNSYPKYDSWLYGSSSLVDIYPWDFENGQPSYFGGQGFTFQTSDRIKVSFPSGFSSSQSWPETRYFHILKIYAWYSTTVPRMYTIYSFLPRSGTQTDIELPPGEYCFAFFGGVSDSGNAYSFALDENEKSFLNNIQLKRYSTDFGISGEGGFWGSLASYVQEIPHKFGHEADELVAISGRQLCTLGSDWMDGLYNAVNSGVQGHNTSSTHPWYLFGLGYDIGGSTPMFLACGRVDLLDDDSNGTYTGTFETGLNKVYSVVITPNSGEAETVPSINIISISGGTVTYGYKLVANHYAPRDGYFIAIGY